MSVGEASGQLALIGLLQFVPLFLLTPFSGLAADRLEPAQSGAADGPAATCLRGGAGAW